MSTQSQINTGLNSKAKSKIFHQIMENYIRDETNTDMVLVCPQEGKSLRVSQLSAYFDILRMNVFSCQIKEIT